MRVYLLKKPAKYCMLETKSANNYHLSFVTMQENIFSQKISCKSHNLPTMIMRPLHTV